MNRRLARRLGLAALIALAGTLGGTRDPGVLLRDPEAVAAARRGELMARAFLRREPHRDTPILKELQWVETDADGTVTLEGWAEAVSRRSHRLGVLTLLSFQDIVAVNVRLRVNWDLPPRDGAVRRNATPDVFQNVEGTVDSLRNMVQERPREGSEATPLLTRTFIGGTVLEGLVVEGTAGQRAGRLQSRTMRIVPGAPAWALEGVRIEAADGRHLTIARAEWTRDGRLVAAGPYTLERGKSRLTASRGCFLVRLGNPLVFRRLTASRSPLCASAAPTAAGRPSSTSPVVARESGHSSASLAAAFVEQTLRHAPAAIPGPIIVQHLLRLPPTSVTTASRPPAARKLGRDRTAPNPVKGR